MSREEIIAKLRGCESLLRPLGVASLYLFGSRALGDAKPDSDVDLFFDSSRDNLSLLDVIGVGHRLQDEIGLSVDITTRESLHPRLRAAIEAEAVRVY